MFKCFKIHPLAKLPEKSYNGDAGYDLRCVPDDDFVDNQYILQPNTSHIFHTGLKCAVPFGHVGLLWDRSGLACKKQLHRLAGVIDCGYRGEWMVCLINLGKDPVIIKTGDRVIQVIIQECCDFEVRQVDSEDLLLSTDRGEGGFGSTGGIASV